MECLTGYATYCVTHNDLEGILCYARFIKRLLCTSAALIQRQTLVQCRGIGFPEGCLIEAVSGCLLNPLKLAVCLSQIDSCHYLKGAQELLQELAESNIEQHAMSNYPVWYQHINAKLQLDRCGREALPVAGLLATHEPG